MKENMGDKSEERDVDEDVCKVSQLSSSNRYKT